MRIAILGGGFTGLSAAYHLLKKGHQVTLIEKESELGGLAVGFAQPAWDWTLEKAYHHWFTNDHEALNLAREIGQPVVISRPQTKIFIQNQTLPLDSPLSLLKFPYLSVTDRFRTGIALLYLKLTNNYTQFEKIPAVEWINNWMGRKSLQLIWEPLLAGKFGSFKDFISMSWFWARIKKRTPSLAYPEGGFQHFVQSLEAKIKSLGGEILLSTTVSEVVTQKSVIKVSLKRAGRPEVLFFDQVISTLPSLIFAKVTPQLPATYVQKITSISHLHAQCLILVLARPFLQDTYWLNITDKSFPFLVLAEHTNFMDKRHYGNQHLLYIGNYLPLNHPYLRMSAKRLLKEFDSYLKRLNPTYHSSLITYHLFTGPFAQPVVTVGYTKHLPTFQTPLRGVYLANLDMVYPWDRGTNYALEMGRNVAELVSRKTNS